MTIFFTVRTLTRILNLLIPRFGASEHLAYEIHVSSCLICLLDEYWAHHLIVTERKKSCGDSYLGRARINGDVRKAFTFEKASLHYMVHLNPFFFFRAAKKRKSLSPVHEKKRDRATRRLVSFYTSLILVGLLISMIA